MYLTYVQTSEADKIIKKSKGGLSF
jgi:hypothetical protein